MGRIEFSSCLTIAFLWSCRLSLSLSSMMAGNDGKHMSSSLLHALQQVTGRPHPESLKGMHQSEVQKGMPRCHTPKQLWYIKTNHGLLFQLSITSFLAVIFLFRTPLESSWSTCVRIKWSALNDTFVYLCRVIMPNSSLSHLFGYGSEFKSWVTTDSSLFLGLICLDHPITEAPNLDPYRLCIQTSCIFWSTRSSIGDLEGSKSRPSTSNSDTLTCMANG